MVQMMDRMQMQRVAPAITERTRAQGAQPALQLPQKTETLPSRTMDGRLPMMGVTCPRHLGEGLEFRDHLESLAGSSSAR